MKARLVVLSVVSVLAILLLAAPVPAGDSAGLKAGAARIDITPEKPVTLSGYAARKEPVHRRARPAVRPGRGVRGGRQTPGAGLHGHHRFLRGTADYMRKALLAEFNLQPSELFLAGHSHARRPHPDAQSRAGPCEQCRVYRGPQGQAHRGHAQGAGQYGAGEAGSRRRLLSHRRQSPGAARRQ